MRDKRHEALEVLETTSINSIERDKPGVRRIELGVKWIVNRERSASLPPYGIRRA